MKEYKIDWHTCLMSEYKLEENPEIYSTLTSDLFLNFLQTLPKEVLVVLGWDGSLLEAIQKYYPKYTHFCGINHGNKGFLMHPSEVVKKYSGDFTKHSYPLISCSVWWENFIAFNEFDIKVWDGKMLDMKLTVGSHSLNIIWDGLIVASPAGSTGYSSSLGGPILSHDTNSFIISPKAPWKPKALLPIILSSSDKLHINTQGRAWNIEIYADGWASKTYNKHIDISLQILPASITLYIDQNYEQIWNNRVLEEQGFKKIEDRKID